MLNRIMKKITFFILNLFIGKTQFQSIFKYLHLFSLLGMNLGGGSYLKDSGEINTIKYIKKETSKFKKVIIFDVGANIGEYTNTLLKLFQNNRVKIYAMEPSKKTFDKLQNAIKDEKVLLFNIGFGERVKKTVLFSNSDESALASVYKRRLNHFDIKMNKRETIMLKTLDSFCYENRIDHINFIKLDVEGNELNVLKGASKMLNSGKIDYVQFEFGGCNIDSRTFFQDFYYILNPNYRIFRVLKNGFYPIDEYKETEEIFITTNYLAKRRSITPQR